MAQEIEITVDFEEVEPVIEGIKVEGMPLYGTATLASSDPWGEPHEFYVKEIVLNGSGRGFRLDKDGTGAMGFPSPFRKVLFKALEDALTNDKTDLGKFMQASFSEAVRDAKEGNPDRAYDERRDHQAMGWM
ncbi:hypothetical protein [Shinella zoogloeoides]